MKCLLKPPMKAWSGKFRDGKFCVIRNTRNRHTYVYTDMHEKSGHVFGHCLDVFGSVLGSSGSQNRPKKGITRHRTCHSHCQQIGMRNVSDRVFCLKRALRILFFVKVGGL
jgi:hypothetical protein